MFLPESRLNSLPVIGSDNKFRILKNGGVHAVLVAMSAFPDEQSVNLNALKVLSNLLESGMTLISHGRPFKLPLDTRILFVYIRADEEQTNLKFCQILHIREMSGIFERN